MTNGERYKNLKDECYTVGMGILLEVIQKSKTEPDKVRDIVGSYSFRKLEILESLMEQADAAFAEWLHEMTAEPSGFKPFG